MTGHSLGGEERRVAPAGVGSSPTVPTWPKTNNKAVLRKMLRERDRLLDSWRFKSLFGNFSYFNKLDKERRLIRLKLKGYDNGAV